MAGEKPYVANGSTADPREQIMWDIYVTKMAKGIENAYEAAIEAGYEPTTAKNVTLTGWYKERKAKLKRKEMFSKAERNLDNVLDLDTIDEKGNISPQLLKIKTDVSTIIVKSLGKEEGYTDRTEHTGKNGESLSISIVNYADNNSLPIHSEDIPDTDIQSD